MQNNFTLRPAYGRLENNKEIIIINNNNNNNNEQPLLLFLNIHACGFVLMGQKIIIIK